VWGQERSSTSKWRRYGSRTDERTCTLLEIVGVLGEVEEIGIHASPPHPHTQKKRQVNGQEKQGYQQENKGMNKRTSTSFYVCVLLHFSRLISPLSSVHWQVYFLFADPFVAAMMTVMKMTRSSSHKNLQIMEREHSDDDRLLINTIQKIRAYTTDQPWSDMNPHPTHVLDLTSGYTVR
jgi:hypothetical protein